MNSLFPTPLSKSYLGQFFIATPLKNGTYSVQAEHPEYKFNPTTVEAKGEIIPPLKVIAIPNKSQ
jgi:hypothetical protein